jgi:excisionase family DNA binding protein
MRGVCDSDRSPRDTSDGHCVCSAKGGLGIHWEDFPLPQLVTPNEAARYLGISTYTVCRRLKSGEIAGRKHGARWLIRVADLAEYVEPNNLN